jgi:hypothetical protein
MTPQNQADPNDESPPIFGSWSRIYGFVLVLHLVLIVLYYIFSQAYA